MAFICLVLRETNEYCLLSFASYLAPVTRRPSWAEESDEGDCAPVPTFQSAFTEALISANWNKYDVDDAQSGKLSLRVCAKYRTKCKQMAAFFGYLRLTTMVGREPVYWVSVEQVLA